MHKIGQSKRFLGRLIGPLLKTRLLLMKNALKPLAKSVLISLGLTAAASPTDAAIHKKMVGSVLSPSVLAKQTTLIIYNKEMNDIIIIVNRQKNNESK